MLDLLHHLQQDVIGISDQLFCVYYCAWVYVQDYRTLNPTD